MSKSFVGVSDESGKLNWVGSQGKAVMDYLKKYPGEWWRVTLERAYNAKKSNPKTRGQLGYYWALLLPEIHKQLIADGHTITVKFGTIEKLVDIPIEAAHEAITALCGNVGDNGSHVRLSECDLPQCMKRIDNVLDLAAQLGMDMDKLKAARPN